VKLPRLSGTACVAALTKAGFAVKRQQGSHIILRRDVPYAQVVVPNHDELDRGTLRAIIRSAGLSLEQFMELLLGLTAARPRIPCRPLPPLSAHLGWSTPSTSIRTPRKHAGCPRIWPHLAEIVAGAQAVALERQRSQ